MTCLGLFRFCYQKLFWPEFYWEIILLNYRIVASRSTSRLVTCLGLFRFLMKGIFSPYVLWPLDKKLIFWIVTRVSARDYTVYEGFIGQKMLKLWRQETWPFGPDWAANIPRIRSWTSRGKDAKWMVYFSLSSFQILYVTWQRVLRLCVM